MLLCVLTASAYGAHRVLERGSHRKYALYQFAQNPPWFKAQLKRVNVSGGTIRLPTGRVAPLQLFDLTPNKPDPARRAAVDEALRHHIKRSKRIVLSGVRITPAGEPAIADVSASSDITFRNVRFLGTEEDTGVALQLDPDDRDITVAQAEFAHCQHGLACILAQGSGLVDRPRALPRRARRRRHPRRGRRRHDQRLRPARRAGRRRTATTTTTSSRSSAAGRGRS